MPGRASIDDNQDSEIDSPKSQIARRHEKTGHRRKALPDPAKLSDGRDPSFEMWLSNMEFKMSAEPWNFPDAATRAHYIKTRTESRAAAYI